MSRNWETTKTFGNCSLLPFTSRSPSQKSQFLSFSSTNARYVAFDFHEVCKGSKFDNLKYLIAEVNEDIKKSMFYWKGPNGMEFVKQETIFRVNCMDCLDRTNVVQVLVFSLNMSDNAG